MQLRAPNGHIQVVLCNWGSLSRMVGFVVESEVVERL
jgi:hypothetical protein